MSANPELGAWLRRQREDRSWTRTDMAQRLITAAQTRGDTILPAAGAIARSMSRWERGIAGPSQRYRLYYCDALGIPPGRLGPQETEAAIGTGTVIITITLPEGADARVRITGPRDSPPAGTAAATAG